MTEDDATTRAPDCRRQALRLLVGVGGGVLVAVVIIYAILAFTWWSQGSEVMIIQKVGDPQVPSVNVSRTDLQEVPALLEAIEQANRTGSAAIEDDDVRREICSFIEARTEYCYNAQVIYLDVAYTVLRRVQ